MNGQNLTLPTVLVIDDERLIQWSLFESLTALGYPVRLAATGAEARKFLESSDPSSLVVILDLRLPDVTDLSLLEDIRRVAPAAPIIVVSAHGSDAIRAATSACGACAFLEKPFDVADVADLIRHAWPPASS